MSSEPSKGPIVIMGSERVGHASTAFYCKDSSETPFAFVVKDSESNLGMQELSERLPYMNINQFREMEKKAEKVVA